MKKHFHIKNNLPAVILIVIGIALIVFGISSGQATSVLNKARKICMECIGIG
ncbi:MAG: hypothetical protein IKH92_10200 [Clostridiales bacterium]|nr:hypothetical protein [Clostridiales bacterium]